MLFVLMADFVSYTPTKTQNIMKIFNFSVMPDLFEA